MAMESTNNNIQDLITDQSLFMTNKLSAEQVNIKTINFYG